MVILYDKAETRHLCLVDVYQWNIRANQRSEYFTITSVKVSHEPYSMFYQCPPEAYLWIFFGAFLLLHNKTYRLIDKEGNGTFPFWIRSHLPPKTLETILASKRHNSKLTSTRSLLQEHQFRSSLSLCQTSCVKTRARVARPINQLPPAPPSAFHIVSSPRPLFLAFLRLCSMMVVHAHVHVIIILAIVTRYGKGR